mmetsp:Transcript_137222/g.238628  ORF Transcript_137222/g.238628 Transcript_137222/m.238628 type:complete len:471 (-) Transcript_137222:935-2347(-)
MHSPQVCICMVIILGIVRTCGSEPMPHLTFGPPNVVLDETGSRQLPSWKLGGKAKIHRDFIRLTPERLSTYGFIWSIHNIQAQQISFVAKVRISGRSNTYGDSMAIWITNHGDHILGDLYGFTPHFIGTGIILTQLKDDAEANIHRLSVHISNGEDKIQRVRTEISGCDVIARGAEQRADWTFRNSTLIKVSVSSEYLVVSIDPTNKGEWVPCTNIALVHQGTHYMPLGWLPRSYIGFSATTSRAHSDNHDIIALKTFNWEQEAEYVPTFQPTDKNGLSPTQRLYHDFSHRLVGFKDDLSQALEQVSKREDDDIRRLAYLEKRSVGHFEANLNHRLASLEALHAELIVVKEDNLMDRIAKAEEHNYQDLSKVLEYLENNVEGIMIGKLMQRMTVLEGKLANDIERRVGHIEDAMVDYILDREKDASKRLHRSWRVPFGIMCGVVIASLGFLWSSLSWVAMRMMQRMDRVV